MTSTRAPAARPGHTLRPASPGGRLRRWRGSPPLTLLAVAAGVMMVGLDGTIVAVANPAIQSHLHASLAGIQWVSQRLPAGPGGQPDPGRQGRGPVRAQEGLPDRGGRVRGQLGGHRPVREHRRQHHPGHRVPRAAGRVRGDAAADRPGPAPPDVPAGKAERGHRRVGRGHRRVHRGRADRGRAAGAAHRLGSLLLRQRPGRGRRPDHEPARAAGDPRRPGQLVRHPRHRRPVRRAVRADLRPDQGPGLRLGLRPHAGLPRRRRAARAGCSSSASPGPGSRCCRCGCSARRPCRPGWCWSSCSCSPCSAPCSS